MLWDFLSLPRHVLGLTTIESCSEILLPPSRHAQESYTFDENYFGTLVLITVNLISGNCGIDDVSIPQRKLAKNNNKKLEHKEEIKS